MNIKNCAFGAFLFIFSTGLLKAQNMVTDRPDLTESSIVVPKRSLQLETGIQFGQLNYNPNRTHFLQMPTTLLRFGVFENIEIRLANQFARTSNEAISPQNFGFSDVEFGVKIEFLNTESINARIAFLSHLLLPFGDNRLTNFHFGYINKLLIEHDVNATTILGYNLGYSYFGQGRGVVTYSVMMANMLTPKLGVYAELYGDWSDSDNYLMNTDAGFTYLVKKNLQLDVSYGIGLNYHMHYFSTGISWNFLP